MSVLLLQPHRSQFMSLCRGPCGSPIDKGECACSPTTHTHTTLLCVNVFISVSPQDGLLFRLTAASDWVLMRNTVSQSAPQPGCPPVQSASRLVCASSMRFEVCSFDVAELLCHAQWSRATAAILILLQKGRNQSSIWCVCVFVCKQLGIFHTLHFLFFFH